MGWSPICSSWRCSRRWVPENSAVVVTQSYTGILSAVIRQVEGSSSGAPVSLGTDASDRLWSRFRPASRFHSAQAVAGERHRFVQDFACARLEATDLDLGGPGAFEVIPRYSIA